MKADPVLPPRPSSDDVAEHVARIDATTSEDRDALLTQLLVHVYPSSVLQEG
ncbi:MAG TPA: hypothetical protein VIL49_01940 [Capillimicrobium sp.]|jgi:hypothetical protein